MLGRDKGDRGALIFMGIMIVAIVTLYAFQWNVFATKSSFVDWLNVIASFGSIVVSIGAVLLVSETLRETRRTADAALAANATAREIGEAQIRAYLSCISGKYQLFDDRLKLKIILQNAGQSPAGDIWITYTIETKFWKTETDNLPLETFEDKLAEFRSFGVVPANGTVSGHFDWNFEKHIGKAVDMIKSDSDFVVHAQIAYQDVFGKASALKIILNIPERRSFKEPRNIEDRVGDLSCAQLFLRTPTETWESKEE